ncbi:hypothetical protein MTZ49_11455 [Entomomonas sp. E2T0]|uniref:hypothetical protein n=1 Tax=Entomomonas sp. E2T0 TaxID=2930213 RepID=UPI00222831A2|nr:hypothetical protein [Entomomonas sp. E2T0]UYZ83209.1 hypothetical protein MTZ49_11455 [Entomomonas sp. E2T0]
MSYVENWKQQGVISLWRYQYPDDIHYPNWHITADDIGCLSLMLLLKAFEKDQKINHKTITITAPSNEILGIPNNRVGVAKWIAPKEWHISFCKQSEKWEFSAGLEPATLTIGKNWLSEIRWAIDGIMTGESNSWVGINDGKEEVLWYWRYPKAKK